MDLDIEDDVALITGSATGLGHACAEAFSRQGVDVALASPNLGDLAYASDRLDALGEGDVFALEVDVRDPDHVTALVEETVEQYGRLDHVVTGPRALEPGDFLDVSDRNWFRAFDRLLMSVVWVTRAAYPHLEASDAGTIVNVVPPTVPGLGGEFALANSFGRAVVGLTETQSRAFAPAVRVNSVRPGPHETDDLEAVVREAVDRGEYEDVDAGLADLANDVSLERVGDPLDLGKLIAFLSSPHASFVNGASIPVDGGSRN